MSEHVFVLGATGFIGSAVVREAVALGLRVTALSRSEDKGEALARIGARVVIGDAMKPEAWVRESAGAHVVLDLLQPPLPRRIGRADVQRISASRLAMTRGVLAVLQRPLYLSVSGIDDLAPDPEGRVGPGVSLRQRDSGFSCIGIPVRRLIERSGIRCAFAYLGTVYGPGKGFAETVFPQLASGTFRMPGRGENRMALVHVDDTARALAHLIALGPDRIAGESFVISDGHPTPMRVFLGFVAARLGAPAPRAVPVPVARVFGGAALIETMTRDVVADPSALTATGFAFRYPTYREGVPPSLAALGYPRPREPRTPILDRRGVFWVLCVLAVGALLAENLLHFPLSVPAMRALAGGLPILDTRFGYTPESAYRLFDALGRGGRVSYLTLLWSVDLVLPASFGTFLSAAIRRGAFRAGRLIPLAGAACDYVENVLITALLLAYPARLPALVWVAATWTVAKQACYGAGVVLAIGGGLVGLKPTVSTGASRQPYDGNPERSSRPSQPPCVLDR